MNVTHQFSNTNHGVGHWTTERIKNYTPKANEKILDLACGNRRIPGAKGIDKDKNTKADYHFDLENKWPIKSNSIDTIFCLNFLEHTLSFDHVIREMYRVLKDGGRAHVEVPYYNSYNFGQIPTHQVNFAENSIEKFYTVDGEFHRDKSVTFTVVRKELYFTKPALLIPMSLRLSLSHYIGNLCYQLYWELEKIETNVSFNKHKMVPSL